MVSKSKYYELKAKGCCVKCGKERGDSPSKVRCIECNTKFLETKKTREAARFEAGTCIQCGDVNLVGNSKYCNSCREKNNTYKKNLTAKPISLFKESNAQCRLCNEPIDTLGIICQKCLSQVQFAKADALNRYGNHCLRCNEPDEEKLVFASSDITQPMKHSGPDLYKYICFSTTPPRAYIVLCSNCYWQTNIDYIKGVRHTLLSEKKETTDIIVDAVENEEIDNDIEDEGQ